MQAEIQHVFSKVYTIHKIKWAYAWGGEIQWELGSRLF